LGEKVLKKADKGPRVRILKNEKTSSEATATARQTHFTEAIQKMEGKGSIAVQWGKRKMKGKLRVMLKICV